MVGINSIISGKRNFTHIKFISRKGIGQVKLNWTGNSHIILKRRIVWSNNDESFFFKNITIIRNNINKPFKMINGSFGFIVYLNHNANDFVIDDSRANINLEWLWYYNSDE